jgi:hypothetical protein
MTECETMETTMSWSAGLNTSKEFCIASTHDGQCKLEMKHVVVRVASCGSRVLELGIVGDMVLGELQRGSCCNIANTGLAIMYYVMEFEGGM